MKMNNKLICLPIVMMAFTSLLVVTNSGFIFFPKPPITRPTTAAIDVRPRPTTTTARPTTATTAATTPLTTTAAITILSTTARTNTTRPTWTSTTGSPAQNLNGKMFTLSYDRGGISFFPPNYSPNPPSPRPSSTPYPTSGSTNSPWTTAAPPRGVSVCLRYLTDYNGATSPTIFTLSPSSRFYLKLVDSRFSYNLYFDSYYPDPLYFNPNIRLMSGMRLEAWTRVCVTVDTVKKVAQVFKGPNMSIRKILPSEYVWSGQPVIDFSGFDGQVTDVQVWDYPLRNGEVFNYMTRGVYEQYRGSVLTWSSISYSPRGDALLEDAYEWQSEQPIRRRGASPKGRAEEQGGS